MENLCHIPVPELIGFRRGLRVWLEVQFLVGTYKEEVQIGLSPPSKHFGAMSSYFVSMGVGIHVHGDRRSPKIGRWIGFERHVRGREDTADFRRCRPCTSAEHDQQCGEPSQATHPDAPVRTRHLANADKPW